MIGLPVRVGDIRVGFVSDVILCPDFSSVLGCEVGKPGGTQAFLPWIAANPLVDAIEVVAATALLGEVELRHYTSVGVRLTRILGTSVPDGEGLSRVFRDAFADSIGTIVRLVFAPGRGSDISSESALS